ncbi:MAG TPA: hypothetical protein VFP72_07055, partial [Kineosporiaceae bacterium]|nr:hypothetical protein [Kineosporiaceae bacterium]
MSRWSSLPRAVLAASLGAVALCLVTALPADAAQAPARRGPVVLVGTGGVRWEDLADTTPALQTLLADGAVGDLTVRGVREATCPV